MRTQVLRMSWRGALDLHERRTAKKSLPILPQVYVLQQAAKKGDISNTRRLSLLFDIPWRDNRKLSVHPDRCSGQLDDSRKTYPIPRVDALWATVVLSVRTMLPSPLSGEETADAVASGFVPPGHHR